MEEHDACTGAATFMRVFSLDELKPGSARVVTVGEYEVGVFNVDGTIYAIDDLCPHVGGPLHSGHVDNEAKTVTCPLHAWDYSLVDGTACIGRRRSVAAFDVSIRDGQVYVASDPRAGSEMRSPSHADHAE
jgi:nitrite reductase (NADH) small subunit